MSITKTTVGTDVVRECIFYAMELTGFNPKNITKESLSVLIQNIIRGHPHVSSNKFREAFELGVDGKLGIDLNTYQNFNSLYISNVLQAYKRYTMAEKRKPKVFELPNPNPTSSEELEKGFYWVKFNFLDESERNGNKGSFPDIIICNWKDAYLYMIGQNMIEELKGLRLKERLKEVEAIRKREESSKNKQFSNSVGGIATKTKEKTMLFYKCEVCDWFYLNREKLIYEA